MQPFWKVGELAKLTRLTVRTLHYYDQIGLFSPSGQTESGHRLYSEADLSRLHHILSLKELGLSLEEIKSVMDGGHIGPLEIVNLQIERIQEQIKLEQKRLEQLRHVSKLMQGKAEVTADHFISLLQTMKAELDKPVLERRASWERHLDLLGEFIAREYEQPKPKEEQS
ncbi:MerR family transcriptional regulator [Paenibacillus ginsengarvi]|uniref:MerR family transcriptional regulator n=1 Tax=Paenibacillus ginsengarvi TaxID=400777 RepID=A0A3B0CMF6_9BACL|nr:MerR family transcriptional regulator [Paenibacillus ginsengarvi]RKN85938.1 MerR family transcriptional regulator [Paenibacillus ginsengarvi]